MGIAVTLLHKYSTPLVSQQPYCTRTVPYGYPSRPTVQGQYPMDVPVSLRFKDSTLLSSDSTLWLSQQPYYTRTVCVPAALLYKGSTLWESQQRCCTMTVSCGYPSSPPVQEQYPMGITAALLYKDSILWVYQQPSCTRLR